MPRTDTSVEARAPGRVNLIGEHTDYNGGFVMPCAIGCDTRVRASERTDRAVTAQSGSAQAFFDLDNLARERSGTWTDYVRGIIIELQDAGVPVRGTDLAISGDVPIGAGLSSSASLEIAVALALLATAGARVEPRELALLAQRAENRHTGTRCGVMDQIAVVFAKERQAVFLDTRSLEIELLGVPRELSIVICNTMVKRELAKGAYNERRAETEEAVEILRRRFPQVIQLRDATMAELDASRESLDPKLYRRALHVIRENERVVQARTAIRANDLRRFGELMNASHESLRDLYEVSSSELDSMVELAQAFPGTYGARMTGGGFGGCTVNAVDASRAAEFRTYITEAYFQKTGVTAQLYDGTPRSGARVAE